MLIVHLFVSYARVNLCPFFTSSWRWGLAAVSACGSSWTFRFTFFVGSLTTCHKAKHDSFISNIHLRDKEKVRNAGRRLSLNKNGS